jgi:hypothetical protein
MSGRLSAVELHGDRLRFISTREEA